MPSAAPEPRTRPPGTDLRLLVPLRPLGPIEVIDRATNLVRTRAADLLGLSLAIQLPVWLVLAVGFREDWAQGLDDNVAWFFTGLAPDLVTLGIFFGGDSRADALTFLASRILPSIALAVTGACTGVMVHRWSRGVACSMADSLLAVGRRAHVLLAVWAIVHAIEIVTCVGVVLGPIAFGVAAPLWAIEGTGPWQAVRRSWELSRRRLWPVTFTVAASTFVAWITAGILGGLGLALLAGILGQWVDVGGTAATALGAALPHLILAPLIATTMALLALDLKVQVEGYDLEVELADAADEVDEAPRG